MVDESKFQAGSGYRGRTLVPAMHHVEAQILAEPDLNFILVLGKAPSSSKRQELRTFHKNDEFMSPDDLVKFLKSSRKVSTYFNKWFYLHKKDALKPIYALWQRLPLLYKSKHFAGEGLNDSIALIDRFATKVMELKENLKKAPLKQRTKEHFELIRNLNLAYKFLDQAAQIFDTSSRFRSIIDLFNPFLNLTYESSKPDEEDIIVIKALGLAYDLSENFKYLL